MLLGVGRGWIKSCKPDGSASTTHSPSALQAQRRGQGSRRLTLLWLPGLGWVEREGPPLSCHQVSPAPVELVSPPGSKLFVDSRSLPSVKRKAFSLSHLASAVSQDLLGLWENMGCTQKPMNRVQFISRMMVAVLLKCDNSAISTQPLLKYHVRPITDLQQSRRQKLGQSLSPRSSFPLCNFVRSL